MGMALHTNAHVHACTNTHMHTNRHMHFKHILPSLWQHLTARQIILKYRAKQLPAGHTNTCTTHITHTHTHTQSET